MDRGLWRCTGDPGQDYPQEKEMKKKAKWLSEEALQIALNRRQGIGKGEKERYTPLDAEFQRIARRDKNVFLSDQCKEIEENNRMGKTTDLFKKIRDTKGTFHAKMDSVNGRMVWKASAFFLFALARYISVHLFIFNLFGSLLMYILEISYNWILLKIRFGCLLLSADGLILLLFITLTDKFGSTLAILFLLATFVFKNIHSLLYF